MTREYCESRENAVAQCPEGTICTYCNGENDYWDDLGWFYVSPYALSWNNEDKYPPPEGVPREGYCCSKCWAAAPGTDHVKRYGLGER